MPSPSLQVLLFDALAPVYRRQRAFHQDPAVSRPQTPTSHTEPRVKDSMRRSRRPCAPNWKTREESDQSDPEIERKNYAKIILETSDDTKPDLTATSRGDTKQTSPKSEARRQNASGRAKPGPHLVSVTEQSLCTTTDLDGERVKAQTHRAQPVRYVSPQAMVQQRTRCDRNGVIGSGGGGTALPR